MFTLGKRAGVTLDYGVQTNWQPVDSQRLMLWAAREGKAEAFMEQLGHMHFEQQRSASHRATLLAAVSEVGLDAAAAEAFLDTDELVDDVWRSYGVTIREHNIRAIPFLLFGLEDMGGPFRPGQSGAPISVNGSADPDTFLRVFETLLSREQRASAS